MRIRKFARHKSNQGYIAAKYPCVIMYFLLLIWLLLPWVYPFAWVLAFVFMFREKDSVYLRLHAAQTGLFLLIIGLICLLLRVSGDIVQLIAARSQNMTAVFEAAGKKAKLEEIADVLRFLAMPFLALEAFFAYPYRWLAFPLLGKAAELLEDKTRPGPLR